MTKNEAKRAGIKGYEDGRLMAPAMNMEFVKAACASKSGTAMLLDAYSYGWTIAHLAEGTDRTFPSVIELKKIMA